MHCPERPLCCAPSFPNGGTGITEATCLDPRALLRPIVDLEACSLPQALCQVEHPTPGPA